jgi:amylosucrase
MALLWDAVATKNTKLLNQGLLNLPTKLDRATWLNYVRCHDDIGLGFDNGDIERAGYDPISHRRFLVDYFTGNYEESEARGQPFGRNAKTGDARISGSLASLVGLEAALEQESDEAIDRAVKLILLLHGMILSFGGIPLLYYGDEIGTLNDCSFLQDENKAGDNRWMHRPRIDWEMAERRHQRGSVEQQIFDGLKKIIAVRKTIPAFADFNNRELLAVDNEHLFVFLRSHPERPNDTILAVANFDSAPQHLDLTNLGNRGQFQYGHLQDLASGESPAVFKSQLVVPPYRFYWLTDQSGTSLY